MNKKILLIRSDLQNAHGSGFPVSFEAKKRYRLEEHASGFRDATEAIYYNVHAPAQNATYQPLPEIQSRKLQIVCDTTLLSLHP